MLGKTLLTELVVATAARSRIGAGNPLVLVGTVTGRVAGENTLVLDTVVEIIV